MNHEENDTHAPVMLSSLRARADNREGMTFTANRKRPRLTSCLTSLIADEQNFTDFS